MILDATLHRFYLRDSLYRISEARAARNLRLAVRLDQGNVRASAARRESAAAFAREDPPQRAPRSILYTLALLPLDRRES